ncbi:GNAT family N-acetyltransferase [Kitasatospora cineracea]|uniref:GNAT family N-acetyltransferase n=1 Tax=Kitasatospora cineracea TaxID=88074 RepID=UPI0033DBDE72
MSTYRVRLATSDDVPALMGLRSEAERWLAEMGVDQWSDADLGERAMQSWLQKINLGSSWVFVTESDQIAATVSRGQADTDFWTEDDAPSSAFYVYKLIVARSAAGSRLGARILDWASVIAAAEGKDWVRLDVWRNNTGLQRYYEKQGFAHLRTEAPRHRLSGWLGQRQAGTVLHPECLLPTIQTPLPSDLNTELAAIQAEASTLSARVAQLRSKFAATSTPTTGTTRWTYDRTQESLVNLDRSMKAAVKSITEATTKAAELPDPSDLAWASAPRRPIESWPAK